MKKWINETNEKRSSQDVVIIDIPLGIFLSVKLEDQDRETLVSLFSRIYKSSCKMILKDFIHFGRSLEKFSISGYLY